MPQLDKLVLVYATFPTTAAAELAGGRLVEEGLAACVNIIPGMVSIYRWEGRRHRDEEVVMLVKTRAALAQQVIAAGARDHPHDNPAFLVLPVEGGAPAFMSWVEAQTAAAAGRG
jgi:periplasmic divalent cation tolerance protein